MHGKSGASRQAARNTGVGRRLRRAAVVGLAAVVSTTVLAACGSDSGPPTLTWYINPDVGNLDASKGGQATLAAECTKAAGGKYKIEAQLLPQNATEQRVQLARRLAAKDSAIDLMSIDPPFTAELANAGFLAPIRDADAKIFTDSVSRAPVAAPPGTASSSSRRSGPTPRCSGTASPSRRRPAST